MNVKRITTALLGFPLVIAMLLIGNKYIVDVAISVIAIFSIHEYFAAVSKVCKPIKWVGYLSCISIAFIHIIPYEYINLSAILLSSTITLALFAHVVFSNMKSSIKDIAYTILGIMYITFFSMFLALVDGMEHGGLLIWYVIFAAWGPDTSAYFVGKFMGKHKFSKVSPKKTIEGCIGGTIGAIIMMLVYTYFINQNMNMNYSYLYVALIGVILSLIGQLGDFAASSIKRFVDIKDYSELIPGHGGMLDRIDSLIFIAPFAYVIFSIL